jgi:uncharacterized Zn-binding protein involved in type VI secretion
MPPQARLGDQAHVANDTHNCPGCPHDATGPAITGSPDVMVNGRPAVRVGDKGHHSSCCGSQSWTAETGSATVYFNNRPAHRKDDKSHHCGGDGKTIEGSPNVITGG